MHIYLYMSSEIGRGRREESERGREASEIERDERGNEWERGEVYMYIG